MQLPDNQQLGPTKSICAVSFSATEIAFVGLDDNVSSIFVDKFSYNRDNLVSIIDIVRDSCNVGSWLIHPRSEDNPIIRFLTHNPADETRGLTTQAVKAGVWRPDVAMDLIYKHLIVNKSAVGAVQEQQQQQQQQQPNHGTASSSLYIYLSSVVNLRDEMIVSAFGALIFYMLKSKAMLPGASDTVIVNDIVGLRNTSFMRVDIDTIEGLSIFAKELHPNLIQNKGRAKDGLSLFTLLDRTKSSLGRQRLREWLYRPLADISSIQNRQKGVEIMSKVECRDLQSSISSDMAKVGDVPRTILRIKKACATSLDWGRFIQSLQAMMRILNSIGVYAAEPATSQSDRLWLEDIVRNVDAHSISEVTLWLDAVISCDDAPTGEDRLSINLGYSETLDKAKALYRDLEYYLHEAGVKILSQHPFLERAAVEYIPHLGYLVAVDDTNINWEGTPFTHRYSDKGQQYLKHPVVEALDRDLGDIRAEITTETENIMRDVEDEVLRFEMPLQVAADTMASLDVIMSFGKVSTERQFVQPEVVEEPLLAIQGGRHPLHELTMDGFIPNDVYVNSEGKNACLVMGPNSSGKSTYLKMVGCIILLTHIGSHVPASKARIGITDMLLTRVSSSMPQSCVEPRSEFTADLNQICSLCRKFTQRSVCIIDDFGKSTAPVDGIALLATLVETVARSRARSIFTLPFPDVMDTNIINPDVMRFITMCTMQTIERGGGGGVDVSDEEEQEIIPLYHLALGSSSNSGGIACARSVGLSAATIARAEQVKHCILEKQQIPANTAIKATLPQSQRATLRAFLAL